MHFQYGFGVKNNKNEYSFIKLLNMSTKKSMWMCIPKFTKDTTKDTTKNVKSTIDTKNVKSTSGSRLHHAKVNNSRELTYENNYRYPR